MTATPIPRSFMLTVFAHLEASIINQSPFGPKPIKTWLVPSSKKQDAYHWVAAQLSQTKKATKKNKKQSADQSKLSQAQANEQPLALVVCPFINPSDHEAFANIASATEVYQQLKSDLKKQNLTIALLHGQQKKETKQRTIDQLFKQEINLLITTSIVEVGVDLPQAKYMIIENADRFGLASLHQLRGRVGRQGQKSFCLLFTQAASTASKRRLKQFAKINNGLKLAELDLENRGGGDLFGLKQHGFDDLRFASWSNAKLIAQARSIFQKIDPEKTDLFFSRHKSKRVLPAAN